MYTQINERVAAEMIDSALAFCQAKIGNKKAFCQLRINNPNAIEHFRYGLAREIGACLGENSEFVKDVYIFPDTLDEDPILTLPLTLIVYVEKHTAALESVVELLQDNFLEEYRNVFSPITDNLSVFLNILLVDMTELAERKGLAASIGSVCKPALRAWSRR